MRLPAAILVSLVTAGATLAACGPEEDSDGGAAGGDPIRLSVGIDPAYTPLFYAQDQGMFDEAGLDVTVERFAQSGDGVDALIGGQVNVSVASDATTVARIARPGTNLRVAGSLEESGAYIKLVGANGVESASEMRRIGVVEGSSSEYATQLLLERDNIDPGDVELVPAAPPELVPFLERGDVDGFVAWEPWPSQAVAGGAKALEPTEAFGYAYKQYVLADANWVATHRDQLRVLMDVLADATKQIEANPDKAAEASARVTDLDRELTLQAIDEIDFEVRPVTSQDEQTIGDIADFLRSRGLVESRPELDKVLLENP